MMSKNKAPTAETPALLARCFVNFVQHIHALHSKPLPGGEGAKVACCELMTEPLAKLSKAVISTERRNLN